MLSLWILSILLLGNSASPLTDQALISDEALEEVVALQEVEEALEEVESRERALEQQLLATLLEEERLLDTEAAGAESGKFIGTNAEGASVTFNDTTASTLSTVGNAALFLGGLYLLSGFPAAASALADPFGISRRLGVAAPARAARPRAGAPAPRFQHRISPGDDAFMKKPKLEKMKSPRPALLKPKKPSKGFMPPQLKSVNRALGAANLHDKKKKPQIAERQQRPQLPRFRIPSLPPLRMPQLPRLRRPTFRPLQFNNPFSRPSRPRPAAQQAGGSPPAGRPAPQNAGRPAQPQPSTQAAPVFRPSSPATPQQAPVSQRTPATTSQRAPVPATPQLNTQQFAPAPQQPQFAPPQQSAPLRLPTPDLGSTDFSFSSDPFSEFQSDNFGPDEESFRDLINSQFGADFDSQRLPSTRR